MAPAGGQNISATSGCLLPRKVWWASKSVAFGQKLRYSTNQIRRNGGPYENEFWVFSYSEMYFTNRAEKVDEKNGVICLVAMSP